MSPMPAGSEGVWVVCDPSGSVLGCSFRSPKCAFEDALRMEPPRKKVATDDRRYEHGGYTLQRLPLATPEMVAVMEAAIAYRRCTRHEIGDDYGCEQDDAYDALLAAIDAARAAGGA